MSFPNSVIAVRECLQVSIGSSAADNTIAAQGHGEVQTSVFPWVAVAVLVYLSGVVILLCREILSFIRLFRMIAYSEKTKRDGITICRIADDRTAPFSWGNFIFLHDYEFENTPLNSIYLHEKAHADKRHWIDVLLADVFCITVWYNPFAWLTRQLVKLNHEFEADLAVIGSGIDTYDYQRLLVVKAIGVRANPVTNSFASHKSTFRKRVMAMSRSRASKKTMLIALCSIPAVALAGTALSMPAPSRILSEISDYNFRKELISEEKHTEPAHEDFRIQAEQPKSEGEPLTVIPSPFEDQVPLAEIIRLSVETIQPDKDTKVNINIVVDKDGRVKDVSADTPDGAEVAAAISRNFNGVRFEQVLEKGQPLQVHFVVPVHLRKKE